MKMRWEEPRVEVQKFIPNEYVAACYNIKCNVPSGIGYIETNGTPGYQESGWGQSGDQYLASGYGCGIVHYGVHGVPDDGPVANAMWQESGGWGGRGDYYPVYYWYQRAAWGDQDIHFTKVEDAEWEENPNAS